MYGLKKRQKDESGLIQGAGTGTSDDIKKDVPTGSYIMPADSTQQIGANNLKKLGKPPTTEVNVSNGEYLASPEQMQAIGGLVLDRMKQQTHAPVDKPKLGFKPGQQKPEMYFANGGVVSVYPSADDVRKAQQARVGGPAMRDVSGITRDVNRQLPSTQVQAATTSSAPQPTTAQGQSRIRGMLNGKTGKGLGLLGAASALFDNADTSSEDYRERFGLGQQSEEDMGTFKGFMKDFGVRGLGYASDLGNALTFGQAGKLYADKQRKTAEAQAVQNIAASTPPAKTNAARVALTPSSTPQTNNVNQAMNKAMYGEETPTTATNSATPTATPAQSNPNPYAIQQKGNAFSYADPGAAAQARANGVAEGQSPGINVQSVRDPNGVSNMMQNTREMGANDQQIQNALAQRLGMQGFGGIPYPTAPQRTDAQEAERRNVIEQISRPIAGARGMTANQRSQLMEMQQGDDNRANARYTTDANNATSQLNNGMNNATSLLNNAADNSANITQTAMREQGANSRAVLGENGQNARFGAQLNLDTQRFNADNSLKNREMKLTESEKGFGIRNSQRLEKLYEMYDKAGSDTEKATIQERINRYTGGDKVSGRDRFITVGGGQQWDEKAGTMVNQPQQLFDTQTQQYIGGGVSQNNAPATEFEEQATYRDPDTGQLAYYKNGKFVPVN